MSRAEILSLEEHLDERARITRVNRFVLLFCSLAAAALVAVAGGVIMPRLHESRKEMGLVMGESQLDDMPPSVALPGALLSTFRGLAIHFLWTRSEELKQQSKYFELQQLSEWICALQPRYPKVWENAAWNMAYNISVGTYNERERWYWVSAGANLLRDKGIPLNPDTFNLYFELARIYLHKMGDFMDDHHYAYKKNWAFIVENILGQPPPEEEAQATIDAIRSIADAAKEIRKYDQPKNPEALRLYIENDRQKPSMGEFVDRLADGGFQPDSAWLKAVAKHDRRELRIEDLAIEQPDSPSDPLDEFKELMSDEKLAPARDRLLAAVRAHVLAAELKMDPEVMVRIMQEFGPIDWRTVYSQGMYWAWMGAENCEENPNVQEAVDLNTHRYIQFGIKDTWERGLMVFEPNYSDPFESFIAFFPDLRLTDAIHRYILDQAEMWRGDEEPEYYYEEGPAGRHFKDGHVNFLHNAIRDLYFAGMIEKAQKYYDYLRENYPDPMGMQKEMYFKPLKEFALSSYLEDITSFKQGPKMINTTLARGYVNLAYGRHRAAMTLLEIAKLGYDKYMEGKQQDRLDRRKLPPWDEMRAGSFADFMEHYAMPLIYKARAWRRIEKEVQLRTYRRLEDWINKVCAEHQPPLDPEKAFPAPQGLAEYEAKHAQEQEEERVIDEGSGR